MKLYVLPTPIGNLEDITMRTLRILKEVDVLLCEDTRTTQHLLQHYDIKKKLIPFHQHNEHKQLSNTLDLIRSHAAVGLVSDAGTPGISDPGFLLIRECIANNIPVETLPGATAFVLALINSGFPSDAFYFAGFLPHKKGRQTRLKELSLFKTTLILYESPHRLLKLLEEIQTFFNSEITVSVSRELTKKFEENFRGSTTAALQHFTTQTLKGEIVVVIDNND